MKTTDTFCGPVFRLARLTCLAAASLLVLPGSVRATIIASDSINYAAGSNNLQGQTGGTGWAAGWLAPVSTSDSCDVVNTTTNPLTFTPVGGTVIGGGTNAADGYGTVTDPVAARRLATPLTGTFYVSYLVQYGNTNVPAQNNFNNSDTFALHLSDTASDTTSLNFGMRSAGGISFMTRNGTGTPVTGASTGSTFAAGGTHLLVARLTWSGSAFNHIDCWLDPAYASSNSPVISLSAGSLTSISYVFFRAAASEADDRYLFNNLVIGTAWNDVVPPGAAPVAQIGVETAADGSGTIVSPQNLAAGSAITAYAIARDANNTFLTNIPATWSEQSVTGGIVSGDLVPSGNAKSAVFTGHLAGSASLLAQGNAPTSVPSGTVTVVPGAAAQVVVETAPDGSGTTVPAQVIGATDPLTVYAIVRDAAGNYLSNAPAVWSLPVTTGGVAGADLAAAGSGLSATFTGNLSGTAVIQAAVAGLSPGDSGVLTVVPAGTTVIAQDTFTDTPGVNNLQGNTGGTGWAGPWLPPGTGVYCDVVDASTNPLVFTPAGGATINGGTGAAQAYGTASSPLGGRQLAAPLTNTFYVSYLVQYDNANNPPQANFGQNDTFTLFLSNTPTNTGALNFGMRSTTGLNTYMVRNGTGDPVAGAVVNDTFLPGVTHLMVAKLTWAGGVFNRIDCWLDPAFTNSGTPAITLPGNSLSSVSYVFFRPAVNEADDLYRFGNLVIGETWDDVVPSAGPPYPQISVETAPDGSGSVVSAQTIGTENAITVYAVARDTNGVFLTNAAASWSVQNVTGGMSSRDLVPAANGKSAVFTGHLAGSGNVQAAANSPLSVPSGTLTVLPGAPALVSVETAPDGSGMVVPAQTIGSMNSLTAYAIIRDTAGNFLSNGPAIWSLATMTGGVAGADLAASGDGMSATFTANISGTVAIQAAVTGLTPVDSGLLTVVRGVVWVGDGTSNNWDYATADWTPNYGTPTTFYDGDGVTFDGSGSQAPSVNLTATVSPSSVMITGGAYTIGGSGGIAGPGGLTNVSGSPLILLTSNNYAGPTVVSYGTLQLGNGLVNGSLGRGNVTIGTGDVSPIFNRTDTLATPYVVSNTISGPADFTMEFLSGVTTLTGTAANTHAMAHVYGGATLILGKTGAGSDIGTSTAPGGTPLTIDTGGTVMLGVASTGGDHITASGKYVYVDGTLDANGVSEAFGVLEGGGILDNTGSSNAVFTVNQGAVSPGVGNNGETYTFGGIIRNTGAGKLGLTKDGLNTLILASANPYGGDTQIIDGGILQLGNSNAMENSTLNLAAGNSGSLSFGSLATANLGGLKGTAGLDLDNTTPAPVILGIGSNGQSNVFSGVLSGAGSLIKTGGGTQTLGGLNTYSGTTTIAGGTLVVAGALGGGSVMVNPGGTLGGTGVIGGATAVAAGGWIAPGPGVGTLTISNAVTLQGGALLKVSRTNSPNADRIAAAGIALGGTLTVTNTGPAILKGGDSFTLFSGSLSGAFTAVNLPALMPGLAWQTNSLNSAGTVSVTGTIIPPLITAAVAGGSLQLGGTGGVPNGTYYLVSSTNLAGPLSLWSKVATNTFGPGGSFSNSVAISQGAGQKFYALEIP